MRNTSTRLNRHVAMIVLRNNAESVSDRPISSLRCVLAMTAQARADGFVCFYDSILSGGTCGCHLSGRRRPVAVNMGDYLNSMTQNCGDLEKVFLDVLDEYHASETVAAAAE
ncbi:hypothetical protein ACSMXM_16990 [Pacificimonas sp. ICDLI1SI03]